jgi:hypothetical protein
MRQHIEKYEPLYDEREKQNNEFGLCNSSIKISHEIRGCIQKFPDRVDNETNKQQ